jgi:hypothetical protein
MSGTYPYTHTWDEDGIQRQAQIHLADNGSEAVWDPRTPGDSYPWQDLDNENRRHSDSEITTL